MKALNINTNEAKLNFVRFSAGQKLTEFWEKEVRIRTWIHLSQRTSWQRPCTLKRV